MLQRDSLDQEMAYAEGKHVLVLDDLSQCDWDLLLQRRSLLDGLDIVGNKKFEEQRTFKLPGVVICSNLKTAELMTQKDKAEIFIPEKDDKYYHLKTRGYHWKAHATQPPKPPDVSGLHMQIGLAKIIHSVIKNGMASNVFKNALECDGFVYGRRGAKALERCDVGFTRARRYILYTNTLLVILYSLKTNP